MTCNHRSKARLEARHARNTSRVPIEKGEKLGKDMEAVVPGPSQSPNDVSKGHNILPFDPSQDIVRGVVFAGQVALGYAFMLVIM